jgi:hypothetical protein
MQVDWISAFCESKGFAAAGYRPYETGRVLLLGRDGELERESSRGVLLEGSYDSRLLVQSRTGADLYLSGNPVKFIQGHNLYGPSDPTRLFFDAGWEIRKALGLFPSAHTWEANDFVGPRFTRIDLTRSFRFPSAGAARSWLRDCAASARSRHKGGVATDGTVYFGKNSQRWTLKCYHKGDELQARGKGHGIPQEIPNAKRLLEWAQGVVRFEVTLRAKELEKLDFLRGGVSVSAASAKIGEVARVERGDVQGVMIANWQPLPVWQRYFDKITWNQNAQMTEPDMLEVSLPVRLQGILEMWRSGIDLRTRLSKPTFYRTRAELLKQIGVDIASPPPKVPAATELQAAALDPSGWDPEPLEGYAWDPRQRDHLVGS